LKVSAACGTSDVARVSAAFSEEEKNVFLTKISAKISRINHKNLNFLNKMFTSV
jgi:hypothetical protein